MKNNNIMINIQLLRIVLMLMIVSLHYLGHGQIITSVNIGTFNFYLVFILKSLCIIAVNTYIIITGYFMEGKRIRFKKVLEIEMLLLFYSLIICFIAVFIFKCKDKKYIVESFFPFTSNMWWFASNYILLYIFIPILNFIINKLNKFYFTLINILIMILIGIVPILNLDINMRAIYIFIALYFFGAYIKRYKINLNKNLAIISYLVLVAIISILNIESAIIKKQILGEYWKYDNIFIILASIMFFIYFKNIKIKGERLSKLISTISSTTFSIYLIHDNPFIRSKLYNWLKVESFSNSKLLIFNMIIIVTLIFISCSIIDIFRQKIIIILNKKIR